MQPKTNTTADSIRVSDGVIVSIVSRILDEIDGVYSLAPRPAAAAERLLSPAAQRPVQTTLHDGAAVIDISVYLCFGCRMKEVSALIQQRVKDAVQDMTGIAVSRVNIYIAGVKAREV